MDDSLPVPPRINIVTLGVKDLVSAVGFYDALGWTRAAASNDRIAWYRLDGAILGLFGRDDLAEDAGVPPSPAGDWGNKTLAINVDSDDAVDAALAAAAAVGGIIVKPARRAVWGGYSGYFADLDGHLWEVAWNPYFPLDAAGRIQLD